MKIRFSRIVRGRRAAMAVLIFSPHPDAISILYHARAAVDPKLLIWRHSFPKVSLRPTWLFPSPSRYDQHVRDSTLLTKKFTPDSQPAEGIAPHVHAPKYPLEY